MKAVRLNADSMTVDEVPVPKPASEQVLIKQLFSGICYRDLLTRRGYRVESILTKGPFEQSGLCQILLCTELIHLILPHWVERD